MKKEFIAPEMVGVLEYTVDNNDNTVKITCGGDWFSVTDLLLLAKKLKKVAKKMEANGA